MRTALSLLSLLGVAATATGQPPLDGYNVVWRTPSADAAGSMPIGNGELGANVWFEPSGDLVLLLSRTDSFSEASRLLKLGRVRISISPNPLADGDGGAAFRQELVLREGRVDIAAGASGRATRLSVFVDPHHDVLHVTGDSDQPVAVTAALEVWRTARHLLKGQELQSSWTMRDAPESVEVWESADVIGDDPAAVEWYHRNAWSVVPLTLQRQGIESLAGLLPDPLRNRTFGGRVIGTAGGFARADARTLRTAGPVRSFALSVAAHTSQPAGADEWTRDVRAESGASADAGVARRATRDYWAGFWDRSWIFVDGDPMEDGPVFADSRPPSRVTYAYVLQRWMTACGGRGRFPIKFNGSIFTVEPKHTGGPDFNPDWRRWGDAYWWQNTRLPYAPMPAAGDFEQMAPLFRFFRELAPVSRGRTGLYYGAKGLYFPETITMFGTYANGDYGWKRDGLAPGDISPCPWWQWAWNQGPELVMLMLDYFDYTGDEPFLREELLPMSRDVMLYFDSRFTRDAAGKLVISPTQSVETYWHDVVNDTPTVAGLRATLPRLLALPGLPDEDRALYQRLLDATPPLPLRATDGTTFIAPAEKYKDQRSNVENPELYALFPFRLFGPGSPDLEIARESYRRRVEKSMLGWSYDGQCAAMLGLTDEAEKQLLAKVRNNHPNHRFPAMWGPNYDWLPDQCHGGNVMLTLQTMAMHADGDRIDLLPAWPRHWNVDFKLHAPHRTTVECRFRSGRIERLVVTPPERARDVRLPPDLSLP